VKVKGVASNAAPMLSENVATVPSHSVVPPKTWTTVVRTVIGVAEVGVAMHTTPVVKRRPWLIAVEHGLEVLSDIDGKGARSMFFWGAYPLEQGCHQVLVEVVLVFIRN
jgi:hypothetical protein